MVPTKYQLLKCHLIYFVHYGCFYTGTSVGDTEGIFPAEEALVPFTLLKRLLFIYRNTSVLSDVSLPAALLRPAENLNIFLQHLLEKKIYSLPSNVFIIAHFLKDFRCTLMYLINRTFKTMTFSIKKTNKQ